MRYGGGPKKTRIPEEESISRFNPANYRSCMHCITRHRAGTCNFSVGTGYGCDSCILNGMICKFPYKVQDCCGGCDGVGKKLINITIEIISLWSSTILPQESSNPHSNQCSRTSTNLSLWLLTSFSESHNSTDSRHYLKPKFKLPSQFRLSSIMFSTLI